MDANDAKNALLKAAHALTAYKQLPIRVVRIEDDAAGTLIATLVDDRLQLYAKDTGKVSDAACTFTCKLYSYIYKSTDRTIGIDLVAGIPENADEATKVTLRMAFDMITAYTSNVIAAYKEAEGTQVGSYYRITYMNAMAWYNKLEDDDGVQQPY